MFCSCNAVHDLLRGRVLDDIVDQLPILWENLFKVRDDIKESVRLAADTALKTLSRVRKESSQSSADKLTVNTFVFGITGVCIITCKKALDMLQIYKWKHVKVA